MQSLAFCTAIVYFATVQAIINCSQCHKKFACGASAGTCWCMDYKPVEKIQETLASCLCPECLAGIAPQAVGSQSLKETEDFYFENGLMVLTREFLQKRGYCCKNNCRHCPY